MKTILFTIPLLFAALLFLQSCKQEISAKGDQLLSYHGEPAKVLDGLDIADMSLMPEERMLFSCLQGLVNKKQARIFLFDERRKERADWPDSLGLVISEYIVEERWRIIKKYEHELSGVVLYSPAKSLHYRNIATALSGVRNAIPVTERELNDLYTNNIVLPVVEDISHLPFSTPEAIYTHFYEKYWPECNQRMLISLSPEKTSHIRNYGVASRSVILWLDPNKESEEAVLRMYLDDMKDKEGVRFVCLESENPSADICAEYGVLVSSEQ